MGVLWAEIKYIESAAMLCNKQTAIGPALQFGEEKGQYEYW